MASRSNHGHTISPGVDAGGSYKQREGGSDGGEVVSEADRRVTDKQMGSRIEAIVCVWKSL